MSARLLTLLGLALLLTPAVPAQQPEATAEAEAGTHFVTGTALLVVAGREAPLPMALTQLGPLLSLQSVAGVLGGGRTGPLQQAHYLTVVGEEIVLGPDNPVMTVGREIVKLSQSPRAGAFGLLVPLDVLRRSYGDLLGYDLMWSQADQRLYVIPAAKRELEVSWNLVHLQGISTLVLQFAEPARYRLEEGLQRIEIELVGDQVQAPPALEPIDDPFVRNLRFDGDRIVIHLAPDTVAEHYERTRPFRLVFDLYRRAEQVGTVTGSQGGSDGRRDLTTVVIDPGHGGEETGAVGPSGVEEKELTLMLARTLARRIEARLPVEVVLTRDLDADLPLGTRTSLANQNKADLFISLHLNSSLGRGAHGAETYFLSLDASDAVAAAVAELENQSLSVTPESDPLDDLELILWDLAQSEHLTESQQFARLVQQELNEALGLHDRGVKQAPFRVLMGADMPAVLVELGFISNPEEEARLLEESYRRELVDALVRAIERYRAQRFGRSAEVGLR